MLNQEPSSASHSKEEFLGRPAGRCFSRTWEVRYSYRIQTPIGLAGVCRGHLAQGLADWSAEQRPDTQPAARHCPGDGALPRRAGAKVASGDSPCDEGRSRLMAPMSGHLDGDQASGSVPIVNVCRLKNTVSSGGGSSEVRPGRPGEVLAQAQVDHY